MSLGHALKTQGHRTEAEASYLQAVRLRAGSHLIIAGARHELMMEQDRYRVVKTVREKVLFALHNVLRDPPFLPGEAEYDNPLRLAKTGRGRERVKLIMSAEVAPEELYTEGPLVHEFPRTVSRLTEMQTAQYLALTRRNVDTGLT